MTTEGLTADEFAAEVQALMDRVSRLISEQAPATPANEKGWHSLAQELDTALEELQVAGEELRQQNEALQVGLLALEMQRQRYHDLFEFAPDGYVVTDWDGVIEEANRRAETLLNVPAHWLVGKPLATYFSLADRRRLREYVARLRGGGAVDNWQACLQPRGLTCVPVAVTAAPVHRVDHKLVGMRWLIRPLAPEVGMPRRPDVGRSDLAEEPQPTAQGSPDRGQLLAALRETILVLEKTKSAFHSRDLGSLRKRLERLVGTDAATGPPNGAEDSGVFS